MSVWNKDKVERVIRLQHLLESGFSVFEEYDNAFIMKKSDDYKVVSKDYEELWSYKTK